MKQVKRCHDWESIYNCGVPKKYNELAWGDKELLKELYKQGMLDDDLKSKDEYIKSQSELINDLQIKVYSNMQESINLEGLLKRYINMWLVAEGVHYFDEMSKEDEKKLIEIRNKITKDTQND